jgi:DNA-binding transcriptional MerR regulator
MSFKSRLAPFSTYTIGQLSREFGATTRALRFYEEQGLLFPRRRDAERIYSYKDRARLQLIMRGRRVGLSVAEIRQILDLYEEKGEDAQNAQALRIFRERIEALEAQKREVDEAISTLRQAAEALAAQFSVGALEQELCA